MYSSRAQRIQQRLEAEGLDALLITTLPNVYYLSGFSGSTGQLVISRDNSFILTDFRYFEQVGQEVDALYGLHDNTGRRLADQVLPALAAEHGWGRIGFEADNVSCSVCTKLQQIEEVELRPTSAWVEELRLVKDAAELERIRAAIRLNEEIFTELCAQVGPGVREADLAAEMEYRALKKGASGSSFRPIIASGSNSAKPHAGFSSRELVAGAPLTIDMGVRLDGYCSDMTRTVFFRDCPPQWREIYGIVREAKDAAAEALRPGLTGRAVDAVARELIGARGHADHFGHGLGHGIGVEVHEGPRLATVSETVLAPGMVVTNEPGIYLPGEGGVRIEDIFVLTADGAENLNSLPTDVLVVG